MSSFVKQLGQPLWLIADDRLVAHDDHWGKQEAQSEEVLGSRRVLEHVPEGVLDATVGKPRFHHPTGRSALV